MNSTLILQKCLAEGNAKGVIEFLNEIDPRTANERMKKFAEHFKLELVDASGILYAHLSRASLVMGYADESGVRKLMEAYQIQTPKIGWFGQTVRTRIRETFKLNEKDSQATLLGWGGLLVVAMTSRLGKTDGVKAYIWGMEMIGADAIDNRDGFERQKLTIHKAKTLGYLIERYEKAVDLACKGILKEQIEEISGKPLVDPKQTKLSLVD